MSKLDQALAAQGHPLSQMDLEQLGQVYQFILAYAARPDGISTETDDASAPPPIAMAAPIVKDSDTNESELPRR